MEQAVLETAVLNRFLNTDIAEIRIFSRDEKKQDDMRHDYQVRYPDVAHKIKFYIGDVRSLESVRGAMLGTDYIFHAAALKQVPSCEFFPSEIIDADVVGFIASNIDKLKECAITEEFKEKIIHLAQTSMKEDERIWNVCRAFGVEVNNAEGDTEEALTE